MEKKYLDLNIDEILKEWEVWQTIREFLSNAIDEHKIINNKDEVIINYDEVKRLLIIKDSGRGIDSKNFVQNENIEKINRRDLIGKFGVGLKDAIATLVRVGHEIIITSKNGIWKPVRRNKNGKDIETIHMEECQGILNFKGTKIEIKGINKEDVDKAKEQFLMFSHQKSLFDSRIGTILEKKSDIAEIYLNGMKIGQDEKFWFSYNILKPNKKLTKSMNRERTTISRDSYRENIISILKKAPNELLIELKDNSCDEYAFHEIKTLILKFMDIKIVSKQEIDDNPKYLQYLVDQGGDYEIVNDREYTSFEKVGVQTVRDFGDKYMHSYEVEYVQENDLNQIEKENYNSVLQFVEILSLNKKKFEIKIVKNHPSASGMTIHGFNIIWVTKKILSDIKKTLGVVCHELCHSYKGDNDCTLEFEHQLTNLLGLISNAYVQEKNKDK